MKCREGCDSQRAKQEPVCSACMQRLPWNYREELKGPMQNSVYWLVLERALTWLAADDKRSK